ncbi:MAG: sigma-54 dependent transcriptional regulator [bacterium]
MKNVLIAWIGQTDLNASEGKDDVGDGPVAQAVIARQFQEVTLLCNYPSKEGNRYRKWLSERTTAVISVQYVSLSKPTDFGAIYEHAVNAIQDILGQEREVSFTFHLSPGTPAMAAVWIILSKTRFPAELIESSRKHGVETASVPFDISADYIPDLLRKPDEELIRLSQGLPPEAPEFESIIHQCAPMKRLIAKARKAAPRNVPVLIMGESGTGKELLARAIHKASPRRDNRFVAVNCGAIPVQLVESHLFGHEKGAFTGAIQARKGFIEEASGGTLFLDEIGELPLDAQVRLLRALQESCVVRVGAVKEIAVDIRIIAATNKDLMKEMSGGRFREDLFHRLAVAILHIPPLRERQGDLSKMTEHLLEQVNKEGEAQPGFEHKTLSASARTLLINHVWPGNIRELLNTLQRAAIWSSGPTISETDIRDAILPLPSGMQAGVLDRPLGNGLDIRNLVNEVAGHYLQRAMKEAGGNKTKAAQLVGLPSYQTFTNWLKRYGIE